MTFFGKQGGPVRMVLALAAVTMLALLSFVIFNLNTRLDNQHQANLDSIQRSEQIVTVNDQLTGQLADLTALTADAQKALDATAALGPVLAKLGDAIAPAAELLTTNTAGAQLTNEQLGAIASALSQVHGKVQALQASAQEFGNQGDQLLQLVAGLVTDLQSSVSSAQTINQMLPLPG
ncbi:hypothetical protein [Gordonia insulae]|uniref:Uncharacterized protein n=1 Tax=Gordonia insulae TaxID=2420509 RepID=A0A3G8JQ54_9ACTN|nr:hypothetical protein [Gordonia insulae]AZG46815.1 hypothetical protein D7316_03420 [Gordonia insulae]